MAVLSGPGAPIVAAPTLGELTAALPAQAAPEPLAPEQTLVSYVATYGGGRSIAELMIALGYDPNLATRVDQRLQVMPRVVLERLAGMLGRPVAELVWAAGGAMVIAPDPATLTPANPPSGGPWPLATLAPLRVANPAPRPPPRRARLIDEMGNYIVDDLGDYFTVG